MAGGFRKQRHFQAQAIRQLPPEGVGHQFIADIAGAKADTDLERVGDPRGIRRPFGFQCSNPVKACFRLDIQTLQRIEPLNRGMLEHRSLPLAFFQPGGGLAGLQGGQQQVFQPGGAVTLRGLIAGAGIGQQLTHGLIRPGEGDHFRRSAGISQTAIQRPLHGGDPDALNTQRMAQQTIPVATEAGQRADHAKRAGCPRGIAGPAATAAEHRHAGHAIRLTQMHRPGIVGEPAFRQRQQPGRQRQFPRRGSQHNKRQSLQRGSHAQKRLSLLRGAQQQHRQAGMAQHGGEIRLRPSLQPGAGRAAGAADQITGLR